VLLPINDANPAHQPFQRVYTEFSIPHNRLLISVLVHNPVVFVYLQQRIEDITSKTDHEFNLWVAEEQGYKAALMDSMLECEEPGHYDAFYDEDNPAPDNSPLPMPFQVDANSHIWTLAAHTDTPDLLVC
jgi:hypothetical protein